MVQPLKIHILHTNDVHSQLENQMRVGHALRTLRADLGSQGQPVLTFDIGDVLDRVRPETEASQGRLNADMLGTLGIDGWVFGNNEGLTIPQNVWPELVAKSQSYVFGTNIRDTAGKPLPMFTDRHIYDILGVKIGVFGITPNYPKPYEHLGVSVLDPFQEAARATETLRKSGADVVIALSHLGLRDDHALAERVEGIDLILGGHTHQFLDAPVYEGKTAIFQVGKHGLAFGHTTLTVDDATHELHKISGCKVHPHVSEPVDAQMWRMFESYMSSVTAYLDASVCELSTKLETSLTGESGFASLLAEILWQEYPVDCGVCVSGLLGASLLPGVVRKRHLHAACSTPTRPALMTLSGQNLFAAFERALQPEFSMQRGFGFGFRGSVVGSLGVANVELQAHPDALGEVRLDEVRIGGMLLEPTRDYRIATAEYLWLAPVFPELRQGRDIDIPAPLLRDLLMTRMNQPLLMSAARLPHIHITQ